MNSSLSNGPRQIAVSTDCSDLEPQCTFCRELLGLQDEMDEPFGFIPAWSHVPAGMIRHRRWLDLIQ